MMQPNLSKEASASTDLPMAELWELIQGVFAKGGRFRLFPRGTSMLPLIRAGRDSVLLEAPTRIRPRDILLYRRPNGKFILHRLVRATENGLDMCGDNQTQIERNVDRDAILARVVGVYRDDTYIPASSIKVSLYTHILPVYKALRTVASHTKHTVMHRR